MRVQEMTKEDFKSIPHKKWDEDIGRFKSLVIIPTRNKHDSGYMCMEFVAVNDKDEPICKMSGCSDVIHIDGIGGYGKRYDRLPEKITPRNWRVDCLPCGYLRLFYTGEITCGCDLSDFEVFGESVKG